MPRHRIQDEPIPAPEETEGMRRAREQTAARRAALAEAEQEEQRQAQEDAEKAERERERLAKIAEADAETNRELDAICAVADQVFPPEFKRLGGRLKRVMLHHDEKVRPLGVRAPEQVLNRHPVVQYVELLEILHRHRPPAE